MMHLSRTLCALSLLAGVAAGQAFDLIEINLDPLDPQHPGITHAFAPVGDLVAEAAGVAVADVDNDGLDDIFYGGTEGHANELYLNDGDGTFTESAAALGVDEPAKRRSHGLFFDMDNDGDLDLVTFGYPSDKGNSTDLYSLFRNDGAPGYTFTDVTAAAGGFALAPTLETTTVGNPGGSAVADYDNDGYLDFIATYWSRNGPMCCEDMDQFRLWKSVPNPDYDPLDPSDSPRLFVDATLEAGLDGLGGSGWIWTPTWEDFDRDGWVDLHINVETAEDLLLMNNGDGTFAPNVATAVGMNFNGPPPLPGGAWAHEMGTGVGDFDNDGDADFYLTNPGIGTGLPHKEDAFYRNDTDLSLGGGGLAFHHIGAETGVTSSTDGVGWGALFVDLDNDGDKDLATARGLGSATDPGEVIRRSDNSVWENLYPLTDGSGNVECQDVSAAVSGYTRVGGVWDTSRGLSAIDLDQDGDLDLLSTRSGSSPPLPDDEMQSGVFLNTLMEDTGGAGVNWLQVRLVESGGSLNTVGARVWLRAGGPGAHTQYEEVRTGTSFLSQESSRLHFGLGAAAEADWLVVQWKDGALTVLTADAHALSGMLTIERDAAGAGSLGDANGDGLVTCLDLELLGEGVFDAAAVDALLADWPWRLTADGDGNGVLDGRDLLALRPLVGQPFCDVGLALDGALGDPRLRLVGSALPDSPLAIQLRGGAPNVPTFLVLGVGIPYLPFKGGVLVPTPDVLLGGALVTDAQGNLTLNATFPSGLPTGLQIQVQAALDDDTAVAGWALSNGVSVLVP